eukprot:790176_1
MDIWLIVLYIIDPVYGSEIILTAIYTTFHTLFTAIPCIEFMWFASKISNLYLGVLDRYVSLLAVQQNENTLSKLNTMITLMGHNPMLYYLFGIQVTWKNIIKS